MNRPLHIVFITNNYLPYSGGVVSSIHALYDELVKQGHQVTIVTLDFLRAQYADSRDVIRLHCPIKFVYKQNYMAIPFFMRWQLKRILRRLRPDIVHVHHPFFLGHAGARVAKKLGINVVFTYHTNYDQYLHYIPLLPQGIAQALVTRMVHNFCAQVDSIIAPNASIIDALRKQRITTKAIVVPSPLNPLFFEQQYVQKNELLAGQRRWKLLAVSRFAKEKNIPFLLDMYAQLDAGRYELAIVGYGNEYQALRAYAYETLRLSPNDVYFIERPTKQALLNYYRTADLFVNASQTETQGLVMLESMACGTPVVTLDGPGQREYIRHGINGFLMHNQASMIQAIETMQTDSLLYARIAQQACSDAQSYMPSAIVDTLIKHYCSLI